MGEAPRDAWRADRAYLDRHRYELAHAVASRYPATLRVPGTVAVTRPAWLPDAPVELDEVRLAWVGDPAPPAVTGTEPASAHVRAAGPARAFHRTRGDADPVRGAGRDATPYSTRPGCEPVRAADGAPYRTHRVRPASAPAQAAGPDGPPFPTYADALAALAAPRLLEDRFTYRLLAAPDAARLTYGPGMYLAGLNVGEAVAHETAAAVRAGRDPITASLPLRAAVGDPTDPDRRPMTTALTVLTLRHDRASGAASFPLHHRDPAAVAHGGGLVQVAPVGVFQPSGDAPATVRADLDLWRCAVREYAEELLGAPEEYPEPFDYARWPPYRDLTAARADGHLRAHLLGIVVDPLTLATDLLLVAVIDAATYDRVFAAAVRANPEGTLTGHVPFTPSSVRDLLATTRLQPAAAAVLSLADRHRRRLTC